jgi:hypothetical protein
MVLRMTSPVQRTEWLTYLSRKTGLTQSVLEAEMEHAQKPDQQPYQQQAAAQRAVRREVSRWETVAEQALAAAYHARDLGRVPTGHLPEVHRSIVEILREDKASSSDPDQDAILQRIVVAPSVVLGSSSLERLLKELEDCFISAERERLAGIIADAERFGDEVKLAEALKQMAALPRR